MNYDGWFEITKKQCSSKYFKRNACGNSIYFFNLSDSN